MFQVSLDGLNSIIFLCAFLALGVPFIQKDNSEIVEWLSAKLLGDDDSNDDASNKLRGSSKQTQSKQAVGKERVRNPITGRWIAYEGELRPVARP